MEGLYYIGGIKAPVLARSCVSDPGPNAARFSFSRTKHKSPCPRLFRGRSRSHRVPAFFWRDAFWLEALGLAFWPRCLRRLTVEGPVLPLTELFRSLAALFATAIV